MNYYFTSVEKAAIAAYVDEVVPPEIRDWSSEYYDSVEQRLKTIFDENLKRIQEVAKEPFNYCLDLSFSKLDSKCFNLIKEIFLKKFQFREIRSDYRRIDRGSHPVFDLVFKQQFNYSMKVTWTPQNPYVYESLVVRKNFEFERSPEKVLDSLWNNAKIGHDTDLTFICEGKIFYAHSSVLRTNFNHFAVMFENSFYKESNKREINVPEASANAFEQFLRYNYVGTLKDLINNDNIDLLLDVFSIAHTYNDSFLMNHAIELLKTSFIQFRDDFEKKMAKLLCFSCLYGNPKLMEIAVTVLEQLNSLDLLNVLSSQNQKVFDYLNENVKQSDKIIEALKTIEIVRVNSKTIEVLSKIEGLRIPDID